MRSLAELKIKLFADGADKPHILQANANPLIRGFTPNPILMHTNFDRLKFGELLHAR